MSIVRCPTCGEIVEGGPDPYCWGCGKSLSGADASAELRLPAAMREARQDAGAGRVVLAVLGALVLAGMIGIGGGWSPGVILVIIIISAAFTKSVASQHAADSGTAAAVTGILDVILKVLAVLFIAGVVLAVGAFAFVYIVCLSQGGGGGWGGGGPG